MSVLVIGSTNIDLVIPVKTIPKPGQTLAGENLTTLVGGKGANQAVAVNRLRKNEQVTFITKLGNDTNAQTALEELKKSGLDTHNIIIDEHQPTGLALILVDNQGENSIVTVPGANNYFTPEDLDGINLDWQSFDFLLIQLEIPIKTVAHAIQLAQNHGKKVILNPAPATSIPDSLLAGIWVITPNRFEAETLSGISVTDLNSAVAAAKIIQSKGAENVLLTLGSEGVVIYQAQETTYIPAVPVKAIDTTGAGDVFSGALTVALAEGFSLLEAADFASKAAALSVTRKGAMTSIPYRAELS